MFKFTLVTEDAKEYLSQVSKEYDYMNSPSSPYEIDEFMQQYIREAKAFGISGVQLSFPYRVFAIHTDEGTITTMFNPKLIEVIDDTQIRMEEGCLSFPGLFLNVKRPRGVRIEYQDRLKKLNTMELYDYYARGFLHELDHLNGVVFTSHVGRLSLKMARKKLSKRKKRYNIQ